MCVLTAVVSSKEQPALALIVAAVPLVSLSAGFMAKAPGSAEDVLLFTLQV
jgi:hypothetical protein